jgi:putative hemolysin
MYEVNEMKEV